jgi:hypothetical protein
MGGDHQSAGYGCRHSAGVGKIQNFISNDLTELINELNSTTNTLFQSISVNLTTAS